MANNTNHDELFKNAEDLTKFMNTYALFIKNTLPDTAGFVTIIFNKNNRKNKVFASTEDKETMKKIMFETISEFSDKN